MHGLTDVLKILWTKVQPFWMHCSSSSEVCIAEAYTKFFKESNQADSSLVNDSAKILVLVFLSIAQQWQSQGSLWRLNWYRLGHHHGWNTFHWISSGTISNNWQSMLPKMLIISATEFVRQNVWAYKQPQTIPAQTLIPNCCCCLDWWVLHWFTSLQIRLSWKFSIHSL